MKINNKSSTTTTSLSWLGKVCLGLTALAFVSCGFMDNTEEKNELGNIGDYVDFVGLGVSVEEKVQPSFSLVQDDGFGLVADRLTCDRIDYSWTDSSSGYNVDLADQGINTVKFIDNDKFTFKLDALRCSTADDPTVVVYQVHIDQAYTFADTDIRLYKAAGKQDLEVTQTGDCLGNDGCSDGSTIGFSLTSFQLDEGKQDILAASFQEELGISFTNGEPIPALSLLKLEYQRDEYDHTEGFAKLGEVWQCDVPMVVGKSDLCSGQDMKNLNAVLISPKDKDGYNANDPATHAFTSGGDATEEQLIAAIKHLDHGGADGDRKTAVPVENILAAGQSAYSSAAIGVGKNGLKALVQSDDAFYDELTKYFCIYSINAGDNNDIGAKCQKVVFAPIIADQENTGQ